MPKTASQTKGARILRSFPPEFRLESLRKLTEPELDQLEEAFVLYRSRVQREHERSLDMVGLLKPAFGRLLGRDETAGQRDMEIRLVGDYDPAADRYLMHVEARSPEPESDEAESEEAANRHQP
jgi:hypothetical protein